MLQTYKSSFVYYQKVLSATRKVRRDEVNAKVVLMKSLVRSKEEEKMIVGCLVFLVLAL